MFALRKKNSNTSFSQTLTNVVLHGLLILAPILVIPLTEQFVIHTKFSLGIFVSVLLLLVAGIQLLTGKVNRITISPLTTPVILFMIAVGASIIFSGEFPLRHLFGMGGLLLSFGVTVLAGSFLLGGPTNNTQKETILKRIFMSLFVANGILVLAGIAQLLGFGPANIYNNFIPFSITTNSLIFNLTGSPLIAAQIALITIIGCFALLLQDKSKLQQPVYSIGLLFTIISLVMHGWVALPGKSAYTELLPPAANWSIVIDTLKNPQSAIIGFGPENFAAVYSAFKPEWLNTTSVWDMQFNYGSSTLFTFIVTLGLFGVIAYLSIFAAVFKQKDKQPTEAAILFWMIMGIGITALFFPPNPVLFLVLAVLLTFWNVLTIPHFKTVDIEAIKSTLFTQKINQALMALGVIFILVSFVAGYGYARAYQAEMKIFESIKVAQTDDIVKVYELQQAAIQLNPYVDTYRRRFSVTNLAIAAALAQRAPEGETLSEADAQRFSEFVQQSISEARAATLLHPIDAINWHNLAQVYRSLIGVVEEADQWATTTYLTAIQLDPTNPDIRIELGGVLYAVESYSDAAALFQQAITLKPDYANGYYNLANTFIKLKQLEQAHAAYQQTLLLLPSDSDNYALVSQEFQQLVEEMETLGLFDKTDNDTQSAENSNNTDSDIDASNAQVPIETDATANNNSIPQIEPPTGNAISLPEESTNLPDSQITPPNDLSSNDLSPLGDLSN